MSRLFSRSLLLAAICDGVYANLSTWMGDGSCPWGNKTVEVAHPQREMPDTGAPADAAKDFDFAVSRATRAPDGVSMSMIVVNGLIPGPLIEANWGDWIEVTVRNEIYAPEEGLAMHWHGLNQPGTPWFDGVPTISQCPVVPGSSLTYRFRADEYGTSWWHSHLSAQYTQGVFGPIVIHGPNHVVYDEDLGVIMANDWYHSYYADIVANTTAPVPPGQPFRPFADSNLVGGVGRFPCENVTDGSPCTTVPYASWKVEPGKTYRARLVNAGSSSFESISIDNHSMIVIANDFIPVQPYQVDFVKLAVGQRTDIVFTATGSAEDSFWIRAFNDPGCADTLPAAAEGKAILVYPDADQSIEPTSLGLPVPANPSCGNDDLSLTVPIYPVPVADPDLTITVKIAPSQVIDPITGLGPILWTLNNSTFIGDMSDPLLLSAITSDTTTFPSSKNVYNTGSATTVRIILVNVFLAPHPMHIHGHDFQVLAQGQGTWDGTITNPFNPQRRDVQMMWFGANATDPAVGPNYLVVQYEADNPGMWNFHCHISLSTPGRSAMSVSNVSRSQW